MVQLTQKELSLGNKYTTLRLKLVLHNILPSSLVTAAFSESVNLSAKSDKDEQIDYHKIFIHLFNFAVCITDMFQWSWRDPVVLYRWKNIQPSALKHNTQWHDLFSIAQIHWDIFAVGHSEEITLCRYLIVKAALFHLWNFSIKSDFQLSNFWKNKTLNTGCPG